MRGRLLPASALLAIMTAGAGAQDAGGVLQAVAKNIGADNLTTLQISGASGFHAFPGASFNPSNDWTRFELLGYTKEVDFNARYLRERITRQFGPYARTGGALGVPPEGPSTLDVVFHRDVAWTQEGGGDGPLGREGYMDGNPIVDMRQLDILLTPHGFIKAALAPGANPAMVASRGRGQPVTYVTLIALGKYRVTATINGRNEIELIQTRIANPMFGDMPYEMKYGPYKQFGPVKFPATIHHDEGDARFNAGHNVLDVQVTDVKANVPLQLLPVPDSAKTPPVDQATIKSDKIGDGIWYIGGVRHGSVAIEFRDFVAVVEAPLNEKRAIAVIDEVYRLVPGKPIRYLVNSHHHFDHSGGLRTFAAEGAAIVTHRLNREFYENVVLSPAARTLDPDRLYLLNPGVARHDMLELVDEKYVVGDDTRTLEVLPLPGLSHAATMVIAYLPRERMAVFADSGPPDIRRLGLEVGTFVSLHGGVVKPN